MWCRPRHRKVNRHAGVYMAGCYCRIADICAEFWSGRATRWGYFGAHVATESIQNKLRMVTWYTGASTRLQDRSLRMIQVLDPSLSKLIQAVCAWLSSSSEMALDCRRRAVGVRCDSDELWPCMCVLKTSHRAEAPLRGSQRLSRDSHQTLGNGATLAINMSAPYQQRAVLWQVPVLFVFYWAIYCRLLSFNAHFQGKRHRERPSRDLR